MQQPPVKARLWAFLLALTLRRLATLVCGVILLISGLGTLSYWMLKWSGNETFVPFGLSTFRSLQWPLLDMFLLKQCGLGAALLIADHAYAAKFAVAIGLLFMSMGVLGMAIDLMPQLREELVGSVTELQPMFLNVIIHAPELDKLTPPEIRSTGLVSRVWWRFGGSGHGWF